MPSRTRLLLLKCAPWSSSSSSTWPQPHTCYLRVHINKDPRLSVGTWKSEKNCSKPVAHNFGCTLESEFWCAASFENGWSKTKDKNMPSLFRLSLLTRLKTGQGGIRKILQDCFWKTWLITWGLALLCCGNYLSLFTLPEAKDFDFCLLSQSQKCPDWTIKYMVTLRGADIYWPLTLAKHFAKHFYANYFINSHNIPKKLYTIIIFNL